MNTDYDPESPHYSIKEWSENDRPREKLMSHGPSSLSDAELIAILIRSGSRSESAVNLSQKILLSVHNDLRALARLSIADMTSRFKGMGEAKAISIMAALELGKRRGLAGAERKPEIHSSTDSFDLFRPILCDLPYEELWCAFVNQAGAVVHKKKFSQGGIGGTAVDIRLILKEAITTFAIGMVLCHNHPSGNVCPSPDDDRITKKLSDAGKLLDIRLLDHIIVSEDKYYSYSDEGKINL